MSQPPKPLPTARARLLYLGSGLALLFGLLFHEQAVVQFGVIGMMVYFVSRWLARINFSNTSLHHRLPENAYANLEFDLAFEIDNRKSIFDTFTIEVENGLLSRFPRLFMADRVRSGGRWMFRSTGRVMNRGIYETATYRLRSRFPFGLFSIEDEREENIHLVVFPRPSMPGFLDAIFHSDYNQADRVQSRLGSRVGDFRGLREFMPGDPLRNVHWSSTARSGQLMVREFDPPVPERFAIIYHCFKPDRRIMRVFSFEKSLRILAGIFTRCSESNISFSFTASFNQWQTIDVSDVRDISEPMTALAGARQVIENSPDELIRHVQSLRGYTQVFVVSNTPVHHWQSYVENLAVDVVCIDNSSVRRRSREVLWA